MKEFDGSMNWQGFHDFVFESLSSLPHWIETDPEPAIQQVNSLIGNLDPKALESIGSNSPALLLARLDLLLIEQSLAHHGIHLDAKPFEIIGRVIELSQRPPGLTYEDLIFTNDYERTRTFTDGEVGEDERLFYHGHMWIEANFAEATSALLELHEELASGQRSPHVSHPEFEFVSRKLEDSVDLMQTFADRIPRTSFLEFSRFHERHPYRAGAKGAGGQFSAALPILDTLLAGERVPDHISRHNNGIMDYMPREGARLLQAVVIKTKTLGALSDLLPPSGDLERLDTMLRKFRARHYRAVTTHIPEVNSGSMQSAGVPTDRFLRDRIGLDHTNK